ncbi:hypothetical protein Hdeb2414_s0023g00639811 [Helianthus debilis subsp. tardiflorus]
MEPIKSNHHPNQYAPLDHAEMPFKLAKITTLMKVICSFLLMILLQQFRPHDLHSSCLINSSCLHSLY